MKSKRKYKISFWIEWDATPLYLWAVDDYTKQSLGVNRIVDPQKLPLSPELIEEGNKLADWFQDSLNWSYPPHPGPWRQEECDRFKKASRNFFAKLQAELGDDYALVYEQAEPDEDPDLDEYLKDPQNFRR